MKKYSVIFILLLSQWTQATSVTHHMNFDRIENELHVLYPSPKIKNQIITTNNSQKIISLLKLIEKYQRSKNILLNAENEIYLSALISCQDSSEIYYFIQEIKNFKTLKRKPLFYLSVAENRSFLQSLSTAEKQTLLMGIREADICK